MTGFEPGFIGALTFDGSRGVDRGVGDGHSPLGLGALCLEVDEAGGLVHTDIGGAGCDGRDRGADHEQQGCDGSQVALSGGAFVVQLCVQDVPRDL